MDGWMEPESKNDCAGEGQKQFTLPDGTKYFPFAKPSNIPMMTDQIGKSDKTDTK